MQKWPAKAGGRSPKGPAVAGTTVVLPGSSFILLQVHSLDFVTVLFSMFAQ